MNAMEFVDAIRKFVMEPAVSDTVGLMENPPGRRPASELVELSAWYGRLPDADRVMVRRALARVAHASTFGLFAVLDGSRKIDPRGSASDYFELLHVHGGSADVLSGPSGEVLHELL